VGARIGNTRLAGRRDDRERRPQQHDDGRDQNEERRQLHFACFDFFPRYSGVRPIMRPAMNTPRMAKITTL